MTSDPSEVLHAQLSARLPAMRDEYFGMLRERVPFYRAMPAERLLPAVETLLRTFLDESLLTWNLAPVLTWARGVLRMRAESGLPRDGALVLGTCFRRLFLHSAESLLDANIPGVPRLLLFVEDFCEILEMEIRTYFDDALDITQKALRESEARYRDLVELSPDGVAVYRERRFVYGNAAAERIAGKTPLAGAEVLSFFPPEERDEARARMIAAEVSDAAPRFTEVTIMRPSGERLAVEIVGRSIVFEGQPARQIVFRDITERRQAEEAVKRAAVQEEIIRTQAATLRAVSTPLIPVSDGVVVMPLVGAVDQLRAAQMQQMLLDGISAARAKVAILDVTGVPAVDAGVSAALLSAVAAARLLGAEVVLTGIKPAAAQAFVELGVDFGRLVTRGTLKDGIAYALARERA
jgi:PAS domain S-box-containing protein